MAAGMIYTIGGSFWEFGGPDLDRSKAVRDDRYRRRPSLQSAQDRHLQVQAQWRTLHLHHPVPRLFAIRRRVGADKAGTDGALFLALIHQIINQGLYDRDFLVRYTNSAQLVNRPRPRPSSACSCAPSAGGRGLLRPAEQAVVGPAHQQGRGHACEGADPYLLGEFELSDGTKVKPAFQLLVERVKDYTPKWASAITGVPVETIERLAYEMGITGARPEIELPIAWTTSGQGTTRPSPATGGVPRDARPGRALERFPHHPLAVDSDEPARHHRSPRRLPPQAPFPRPIPPCAKTHAARRRCSRTNRWTAWRSAGRRPGRPVCRQGRHAGAYRQGILLEYPLSVHGLMHNVITNAWRGDPTRSTRC